MKVSDAMLGSRFWYSADTEGLSRLLDTYAPERNDGVAPQNGQLSPVTHDNTLTSFFVNGSSESIKRAINRAEVFAASHVLNPEAKTAELRRAMATAEKLGLNIEDLSSEINGLMTHDDLIDPKVSSEARKNLSAMVKVALVKLLVSNEFLARAASDNGEAVAELSRAGRDALRNAAIGLTNMLLLGVVSEDAVLYLANGKVHDLGNPADVLNLAVNSAEKVKETFVGKSGVESYKTALKEKFAEFARMNSGGLTVEMEDELARLLSAADRLVRLRETMVASIKTNIQLSGKKAEQEDQVHALRESLRAFRYDLDCCRGKKMGRMESLRRKFDDFDFPWKSRARISAEQYQEVLDLERTLNNGANTFFAMLRGAPQGNPPQVETVGENGDQVTSLSERATSLSHETNDIVRYYFSGHEKRAKEFASDVHKMFDDIVKNGGSRNVSIKVGVNFLMKLNLGALEGKLKAGGRLTIDSTLKVQEGGGPITMTYRIGGEAMIGLSGKVGAGGGTAGADVSAEATGGGGRTVSVTYANLDELIRHLNGSSELVQAKSFGGWVLGIVGKPFKFIGHGVMLGLTGLGFRIHKSRLDSAVYAAKLQTHGVFDNVDAFLSTRKNAHAISDRNAKDVRAGGEVSVKAGVGNDLSVGGGGNVSIQKEVSSNARSYRAFVAELSLLEREALEERFDQEAAKLLGHEAKEEAEKTIFEKAGEAFETILNDVHDTATLRAALTRAVRCRDELEAEIGKTPEGKRTKEFWQKYAAVIRMSTLTALILEERAKSLNETGLAVNARNLVAYLADPVRRLPEDVFVEELMQRLDVQTSSVRTIKGGGEFTVNLGGDSVKKLGEVGKIKPDLDGVIETVSSPLKGAASGALEGVQQLTGAKTTVKFGITRTTQTDGVTNICPWKNGNSTDIDIDVTASMPVRLLVDLIVDKIVQKVGGDTEEENTTLREDIKRHLIGALIGTGVGAGKTTAIAGLKLTVGALAEKVSFIKDLLDKKGPDPKTLPNWTPLSGFNVEGKNDYYKTIHLSFGPGWRLSSFSLSDKQENSFSASFNAAPIGGLGADFSFSLTTSRVNYSVLPSPKLGTLLGRAAGFSSAGNVEGFKHFLSINQKGVFRLLRVLNSSVPPDPGDTYFAADRENAQELIASAKSHLLKMRGRTDRLRQDADALAIAFERLEELVAHDSSADVPAVRLKLAREYLTVLAEIFMLAERCKSVDDAAKDGVARVGEQPRTTCVSGKWGMSAQEVG